MLNQAFAAQFEPITGFGPFQAGGTDPGRTLESFFTTLLGFFTVTGGLAFLIYFVLGAFSWITSRGEKEKIQQAQRYIGNALVGLIYIILAWAITGIIGSILGVDFLDIVGSITKITP